EKKPLLSDDVVEEVSAIPPNEAETAPKLSKEPELFQFPKREHPIVEYGMRPIRYFTQGAFGKTMESSKYQSGWRYLLIGANFSKYRTVRYHWRFGA
ncbi:hypothetical protein PMAYCL1PPCAC_24364, partial [Pristionchus mayeri]